MISGLLFHAPFARGDELTSSDFEATDAEAAPPPQDPPPLPFHTIEGYGGGAITPMAYLVNPSTDPCCCPWGKPAVAFSYVNMGHKNLDALTVSETLFGRLELSYGADRLGVGTLTRDLNQAGFDVPQTDVWLHNFNVRYLAVKENYCDTLLPAVTFGVHFKWNANINQINNEVNQALSSIGYTRDSGQDYTVTLTKTLPKAFGRPVIVSGGLRASQAANLGFLGFGDSWHTTFEGSVAYLPCDRLLFAYEFRGKASPFYGEIPGLIGDEDSWHAFDAALILNSHSTLVAGYGMFGTLANTDENSVWWLQLKYEF
jgi:hypothetical protein